MKAINLINEQSRFLDDKKNDNTIAIQIVNVNNEKNLHEVILNTSIGYELKNLNIHFVEAGYATCIDNTLYAEFNNTLLEKLKEEQKLNSDNLVKMPKIAPKLTKLDKDIKDILKVFEKTIRVKLDSMLTTIDSNTINTRTITHKKYIVSNCLSPNEIWIREVYNLEKSLKHIEQSLNNFYANANIQDNLSDINSSSDNCGDSLNNSCNKMFKINELCIKKHAKYMIFQRCKIVEKSSNDTYKVYR